MLRSTLRCGNSANDWKTIATPRRAGSTPRLVGARRSARARRPSGSSPAIARSSVDFPEPEAPSTATSSPGATVSDSPRERLDRRRSGARPLDVERCAQNLPSVSLASRSSAASSSIRP